ncbi:MAG: ribonuclease III [Candidatus Latescibacterota bacterium]|nr:MAG: ribonuclease III [Candidatus Latescibacterota bacterium]
MLERIKGWFRSSGSPAAPPDTQALPPKRREILHQLERKLGVRFKDLGLLNQALLHRSYLNGRSATRVDSNERMEFLGDSVLGLVVNEYLYLKHPEENEGNLTKIKSLIVSRQILAQKAEETGLGHFLLLSTSESEAGGRTRASITADALEAVIAAIYLDQGLPSAQRFVKRIILDEVTELTQNEDNLNYKSLLQEKVQGERKLHPVYRIRKEMGPDHEKTFHVDVSVGGQVVGHGEGHTKKEAEQAAARSALDRQGVRGGDRPRRGRRYRRPRRQQA